MGNKQQPAEAPAPRLMPAQAAATAESVRATLVDQALAKARNAILDACSQGRMSVRVVFFNGHADLSGPNKCVLERVAKALIQDGFGATAQVPWLEIKWGDTEPEPGQ